MQRQGATASRQLQVSAPLIAAWVATLSSGRHDNGEMRLLGSDFAVGESWAQCGREFGRARIGGGHQARFLRVIYINSIASIGNMQPEKSALWRLPPYWRAGPSNRPGLVRQARGAATRRGSTPAVRHGSLTHPCRDRLPDRLPAVFPRRRPGCTRRVRPRSHRGLSASASGWYNRAD